eukprot:7200906-Ditylum_brightwellii.AAC.1
MPNKLITSISLYVSTPLLDLGSPIHLTPQDHFTTAPHPILSSTMQMGPSQSILELLAGQLCTSYEAGLTLSLMLLYGYQPHN